MPLTREKRNKNIEKLQKEFSEAAGIYLTDFTGINVEKISGLRRSLRAEGAKFIVVKNSLAKKALEKSGKTELIKHLSGPVGAALSAKDSIAPARVIKSFKKENKELLCVRGALVDGAMYDESQVNMLADLPSRETLLSQLLSCLQAPIGKFAGALSGILTKFVGTLESVRQKKESQGQ